jgi:hypothetical protein
MDESAFQIESPLAQQYNFLARSEYGFSFAEDLFLYEIPIYYADLVNKKVFENPEYDKKNNRKSPIYPYLKN